MSFGNKFGKLWPPAKSSRGDEAERRAEHFLQAQGLSSVTRNYRCPAGEVDLIMRDDDTLVFVEVRLRSNRRYSSPMESVTPAKQQKIIRAAQSWLQRHDPGGQLACRFDVVALTSLHTGADPEWIKSAFDAV